MSYRRISSLVLLASAIGCSGGESTGGLEAERTFTVSMTAAEEVPAPKPTSATGTAQVILYRSGIEYQLSAQNITGITMAHIHNGALGVAGPVVVTLYLPGSPTGNVSGVFASGTLTAGNLPAGVTLESLKTLINSGNAYVNVHTSANPTGEIRGQLR